MAYRWVEIGPGRKVLVKDEPNQRPQSRGPFVRNEHLSPKAKRGLYLQTGKRFETESEFRRYLRDNDLRIEESGDANDVMRREDRKWLRDTRPGEREKNPLIGFRGYHTLDPRERSLDTSRGRS